MPDPDDDLDDGCCIAGVPPTFRERLAYRLLPGWYWDLRSTYHNGRMLDEYLDDPAATDILLVLLLNLKRIGPADRRRIRLLINEILDIRPLRSLDPPPEDRPAPTG